MALTRVLIVDDHSVVRVGLRTLINAQSDLEVVAEASEAAEAVRLARETWPDVVTLDIAMPGLNGLEIIDQLRQVCPQARVLIVTMHDDPAYLRVALAAGAAGYVVKTAADVELLSAIRAVYQGRTFVDLSLKSQALPEVATGTAVLPEREQPTVRLSQREQQVLVLLAQGFTNQQIADHLSLSVKTVETYRARVGQKLGLRQRAELFRYAVNRGLLENGRLAAEPPVA